MLPFLVLVAAPARGAEVTRVVSAMDDDNRFDFNLTATWIHDVKSAFVKRELQSSLASGTELIKDLQFAQTRDILNLRADFGILWDVGLHVDLPLVLRDAPASTSIGAQGANCVYPAGRQRRAPDLRRLRRTRPSCATASCPATAWTAGASTPSTIASSAAAGEFPGTDERVPRTLAQGLRVPGPRHHLGAVQPGARRHQADLDAVVRRQAGRVQGQAVRSGEPRRQHRGRARLPPVRLVDVRVQALPLVRSLLRRLVHAAGAHQRQPVPEVRTDADQREPAAGGGRADRRRADRVGEPARRPARDDRSARARRAALLRPRPQRDLGAAVRPSSACNANSTSADAARASISTRTTTACIDTPHPGITDIEAYATIGGDVGLNVQVGRYIRFRGLFGFRSDLPHFITVDGAGVDRDGDGASIRRTPPRRTRPTGRRSIFPGRRFRVEGTKIWTLFLQGSMMF